MYKYIVYNEKLLDTLIYVVPCENAYAGTKHKAEYTFNWSFMVHGYICLSNNVDLMHTRYCKGLWNIIFYWLSIVLSLPSICERIDYIVHIRRQFLRASQNTLSSDVSHPYDGLFNHAWNYCSPRE